MLSEVAFYEMQAPVRLPIWVPTAWNPNANFRVYELELSGSNIYIGGLFTNVGGQARNRIAAIDKTTGLATAWDPNSNNSVRAIVVDGSTVYVGSQSSGRASRL